MSPDTHPARQHRKPAHITRASLRPAAASTCFYQWNRRFILVEMEDYADRLTAERVRRVINGYAFEGTQKTELLRERLNWRAIERAGDLVDRVQGVENLHGHEYRRARWATTARIDW